MKNEEDCDEEYAEVERKCGFSDQDPHLTDEFGLLLSWAWEIQHRLGCSREAVWLDPDTKVTSTEIVSGYQGLCMLGILVETTDLRLLLWVETSPDPSWCRARWSGDLAALQRVAQVWSDYRER